MAHDAKCVHEADPEHDVFSHKPNKAIFVDVFDPSEF
jgi:hypothetical protein